MPPSRPSDRLSSEDAIFLYLEKNEMPLHIGCVAIFDGAVPLETFTDFVESKLPLIPRYRQRIVIPPFNLGHPTWEFDPEFDIRRHIRMVTLKRGTDGELQAFAGKVLSQIMDRNRPLWDITLVDGLRHGHMAMIFRLHHCLADGVSGVALLNLVLDASPQVAPLPRRQPFQPPPLPDATTSLMDALVSSTSEAIACLLEAQAAAMNLVQALIGNHAPEAVQQWAGMVPDLMKSMDRLPFNAPCLGPRQHIWTDISLPETHAIKQACGTTMNDVVLAVVTRAVSRYAELHGQPVAGRLLRYWVPVNLRPPGGGEGMGNKISILPVTTPLDIEDPLELLKAVHERTQALKRSHVLDLISLGAAWLSATPPPFQAMFGLLGNRLPFPPFHMVCTNVPGPQVPLYLLGKKMLRSYPYVPIGTEMGFCCAIQSYDGTFYIGLTADSAVVPDVARIREFIDQAFVELRQAAGVSPAQPKRAPAKKAAAAPPKSRARRAAKAAVVEHPPAIEPREEAAPPKSRARRAAKVAAAEHPPALELQPPAEFVAEEAPELAEDLTAELEPVLVG